MQRQRQVFNPVLKKEDLEKLFKKSKGKRGKGEYKEKDYRNLIFHCEKLLRKIASGLKEVGELQGLTPYRIIPLILQDIDTVVENLTILNDGKTATRAISLSKKLKIVYQFLSNEGETISASKLKKKILALVKLSKKIRIDEDRIVYLQEGLKAFSKFEKVKLDRTKDSMHLITTPILFSLRSPLTFELKNILEKRLELENVLSYYYIKKAKFIVGVQKKLHTDYKVEEQVNVLVRLLNKKLARGIVPIHEIRLKTKKFYVVWVVPENAARNVNSFVQLLKDFDIFVE